MGMVHRVAADGTSSRASIIDIRPAGKNAAGVYELKSTLRIFQKSPGKVEVVTGDMEVAVPYQADMTLAQLEKAILDELKRVAHLEHE